MIVIFYDIFFGFMFHVIDIRVLVSPNNIDNSAKLIKQIVSGLIAKVKQPQFLRFCMG